MKCSKATEEKGEGMEKQVLQVELPQELIAEILCRLPGKSVLRFKCVSKLWKNLISEPAFRLSNTGREQAIVLHMQFGHGLSLSRRADTASFYTLYDDLSIQKVPHPAGNVRFDYADFEFLGTCDGLILFYASGSMYLWNPLTRCSRELSQLNNFGNSWMASGLCYDKSSDDYKVILLKTETDQPKFVYVVSLRKREIRTDISFPYKLDYRSQYHSMSTSASGVSVSGHLHWIMKEEIGDAHLIVYFDKEINQFGKLTMPEEPTPRDGGLDFGLTVSNGCLCLYGYSRKNRDTQVFMMKEYGVKESWTKLFTMGGYSMPLRIADNDVLFYCHPFIRYDLLREKSTILRVEPSEPPCKAYNLRKESRKVKLEPTPLCVNAGPLMYMESLQSIPLV